MHIDPSWARRLMPASRRLTAEAHLPGVMPGHREVHEAVAKMFSRFSADEMPRVRSWVDGGQRYTISDALIALAAKPAMPLAQRLAEASGSPHYCVTFNGLSSWCEQFAEHMQLHMLDPLFAEMSGAPACGTDFYAFFGNYGFTPFGVHDDTDQSLLWHLGPAPKVAYVWPRATYVNLTGGTLARLDYEALLPYAHRYVLQPGDLLFIPMGDFHILETREFSATLGLTLFPDDVLLECSEALRILVPDDRALRAVVDVPVTLEALATLRRLSVQSNGSMISPPQLSSVLTKVPGAAALRACTVRARPSWPLRCAAIGGRQALLVRRRVIWGRPNAIFGALCDALDAGKQVPYQLLERQMAGKVQAAAIAELVRNVAALGGVSIEPV